MVLTRRPGQDIILHMHVYCLCLLSSDDGSQTFEHGCHIHSGDDDDDDDDAFDDEGEEDDEDV